MFGKKEDFFNAFPVQMWLVKGIDSYDYVNQAHADFWGCTKEELQGRSVYEVMRSEEASQFIEKNREALEKKCVVRSREWLTDSQGRKRLLAIERLPGVLPSEGEEFILVWAQDSTEDKDFLARDSHIISNLIECTADMIMQLSPSLQLIYCNRTAQQWLGENGEDCVEAAFKRMGIPKKQVKYFLDILKICLDTGKEQWYQQMFSLPRGNKFFRIKVVPEKDTRNQVLSLLVIARDCTYEKWAEDALQNSEHRFRQLFENSVNGVALHEIITDRNGVPCDYRFIAVNPAFERITGLKGMDILGRTVLEVLPNVEEYWICRYGQVALTGSQDHFEEYSRELGFWYSVVAYQNEPGQFVTVCTRIERDAEEQESV